MSPERIDYITVGRGEPNTDFELLADIYSFVGSFSLMTEFRVTVKSWKQGEKMHRRFLLTSRWGHLHPAEQHLLVKELPAIFQESYTRAFARFKSVHNDEVQFDGVDHTLLFSNSYNRLLSALDGLIVEEMTASITKRIQEVLGERIVWDAPQHTGLFDWLKKLFK